MKAAIVPIGNSRGIRIPRAILEQCRIKKNVELDVKGNTILIRPLKRKPRQHWEEAFKTMHERREDLMAIDDCIDLHTADWEW